MRYTATQLGWITMGSAVVAIVIAKKVSAPSAIALALATLVLGAIALRIAVRTDSGVAQSLFGLVFGFIALVTAVFVHGGEKGGRYTGEAPGPVVAVATVASPASARL